MQGLSLALQNSVKSLKFGCVFTIRLNRKEDWGMIRKFTFFILLLLLNYPIVFAQETSEKFSLLIENGSRMIRENEIEKVFNLIKDLTPEKRSDFRVRVIENFANLKAYLISNKKEYGKKVQEDYKPLCYTKDKSATPILIDLLKDNDPYIRAFTARALGFLGDHTSLEALREVANQDPNRKVRLRAREGYKRITGHDLP